MTKFDWLKRPSVAFAAMIIGAVIGLTNAQLSFFLTPFGELYLSFLKMLVIPIMITAVISSLGKLLASKEASYYLRRMIIVFLMGLMITSLFGIAMGLIGQPGSNLDEEARVVLGNTILHEEGNVQEQTDQQENFSALDFLQMLVPTNVFQSLLGEQNMQVLFVAIVFGVAIGTINENRRDDVLGFFEITYKTFEKMIGWTMYGLPFGLLCIIANQFASMGIDLLYSMTKLIVIIYLACSLLILLSAFIIWKVSNRSITKSTMDLKEPLLIAFGTRNSLATMPSIFQVLQKRYRLKDEAVNLVVPLSIIICRYSMVILFSVGTIFISQLYSVTLTFNNLIIILFGAVFAAIAGAGAPVLVSLSMITLVLTPLGLPVETALVLLLAVTPIIDPILTMLNVHLTCTASMLIDKHKERRPNVMNDQPIQLSQ